MGSVQLYNCEYRLSKVEKKDIESLDMLVAKQSRDKIKEEGVTNFSGTYCS